MRYGIQAGKWLITETRENRWQAVNELGTTRIEHESLDELIRTLEGIGIS